LKKYLTVGVGLLAVLAQAVVTPRSSAEAQGASRPNILIIVTDDQRPDPHAYGVMPKTWRIFRGGGTFFRRAFTTTPTCCPARASIFSGQYAHNHGVLKNFDGGKLDLSRTLQAELKNAGYQTALSGKYLNEVDGAPPYFDHYAKMSGLAGKVGFPGYYDVPFLFTGETEERVVEQYSTTFVGAKAVEFLDEFEKDDDVPWLLYVAPLAPHRPFQVEPKYASAPIPTWRSNPAVEEKNLWDKPGYVRSWQVKLWRSKGIRARQLRMLMSVDAQVQAIFSKMSSLEENDTLAFFLSDNGYLWGEHGLAHKLVPYSRSIRIPFFARWPGRVEAGIAKDNIVANIDIAPTIYEALGITPSYTVDGRSLLDPSDRRRILIENWLGAPVYAANWRPGSIYTEFSSRGQREFYNFLRDPWELNNRFGNRQIGDEPRNADRLSRILRRDMTCAGGGCP
jgi:arylsulfatase A-like enzyme